MYVYECMYTDMNIPSATLQLCSCVEQIKGLCVASVLTIDSIGVLCYIFMTKRPHPTQGERGCVMLDVGGSLRNPYSRKC